MSKKEILKKVNRLINKGELDKLYECNEFINIYDYKKEITLNFLEHFSEEKLRNNIYISKYIPIKYSINKNNLINKILKDIDINTFITFNGLWIIENEKDLEELYDFTGDQYSLEVIDLEKHLGITWVENGLCIINFKLIRSIVLKEGNINLKEEINDCLWTTIIHELRHTLFINFLLPKRLYKAEDNSENSVEDYCLSHYYKYFKTDTNSYLLS